MTNIPDEFKPADEIEFLLPSGRSVTLPRVRPLFRPGPGAPAGEERGRDLVFSQDGLVSVESAVLRALRRAGWEGALIDASGQAGRGPGADAPEAERLPATATALLQRIGQATGARKSAWEICCWRGDQVLFGKTKHSRREQFRAPELAWLEAALLSGLTQDSFLVIEWDLAKP
jgi:hypothetical protein